MIILGIDPGTATTGYGIISVEKDHIHHLKYGQIKTSKDHLMQIRLASMYDHINHLMDGFKPDILVIERLFFNTNVKTAITVGQARGIYILAAGQRNLPVFEYTALEAKMALTGYGRAEKDEVRAAVCKILDIKVKISPIDASDALAMALCHTIKANIIFI